MKKYKHSKMVLLMLFITMPYVISGCSKSSAAAELDFGPNLAAAIAKAQNAQSMEGIRSIIDDRRMLKLVGAHIALVSRMAVLPSRQLAVLDMGSRTVQIFSPEGQYLGQLGRHGQSPGEYTVPIDVQAVDDRIVVDDFVVHRINEYSAAGKFSHSFTYSMQNFSSGRLARFPQSGEYVLFGNKWLYPPTSNDKSAELANIYDGAGRYERSVLRFPERFLNANLVADDTPEVFADESSNTLYLALPFEYKVYALTPSAMPSTVIDLPSPKFKEPLSNCVIKPGPEGLKAFHTWRLTWTPIVGLWKSGSNIFIEYQTFDPMRYTIDIRDLKTQKLLRQVGTNYRYLTTDLNGHHWFVKDMGPGQSTPELLVGKDTSDVTH